MKTNIDPESIIARIGARKLAGDLGISTTAVYQWKKRGIPRMVLIYLQSNHPEIFTTSAEKGTKA